MTVPVRLRPSLGQRPGQKKEKGRNGAGYDLGVFSLPYSTG